MVHTEPFDAAAHLSHLPRLGVASMSAQQHFRYVFRYHAQFPHQTEHRYLTSLRRLAYQPDAVIRVAVSDDADPFTDLDMSPDDCRMRGEWVEGHWIDKDASISLAERKVPSGRILGYAAWTRSRPKKSQALGQAESDGHHVWPKDNIAKKIERGLLTVMDKYTAAVTRNPSYDPERRARFQQLGKEQYKTIAKSLTDKLAEADGFIYCEAISVDPSFQRCGIGARLMRWGLERAEREGVPVLLMATQAGVPLYEHLGFETLGTLELDHLHGDRVMIYWPPNTDRIDVAAGSSLLEADMPKNDGDGTD